MKIFTRIKLFFKKALTTFTYLFMMLCCFVDDLAHWKPKKKENVTEVDAWYGIRRIKNEV